MIDDSVLEPEFDSGPVPRTGDPAVDEVLDSLDALDATAIDDHVGVFERAHEKLRSALDGPRA